jgi:sialidase-1
MNTQTIPAHTQGAPGTSAYEVPLFETIDLFEAGQGGYITGRVPVMTSFGNGVVLAAWEARRGDAAGYAGDWDDNDILMRRSEDGGKTWGPSSVLGDGGVLPAHNTNFLIDAEGTLHVFFFVNYQHAFHCVSRDQGRTFSAPQAITSVFEEFHRDYLWNVIAAGPGHGIVTRKGRMIVPVWLSNGGRKHRPSVLSSIYSDDLGKTWQRGEIVPPKLVNMNETTGIELEDGTILFNIRSEDRAFRRALSRSPDGAKEWSQPVHDNALKEPICMGNLLRYNFADGKEPGRVLFCNPDNDVYTGKYGPSWDGNKDRVNLTLKMSLDDGATWPISRVIDPGIAGYCDLAREADGTIYVIYERGGVNDSMWKNRYVTFVRTNLAWLQGG